MRIFLIVLLVFFVILFFPVGLWAVYENKLKLVVFVFLVPIKINLEKKQEKESEPEQKKRKKKKKEVSQTEKRGALGELARERGVVGAIEYLANIARIAGGTFGGIMRGVILARFNVYMRVGGEDAAAAATNYGAMCALVYPLLSVILNRLLAYRKRFDFAPDFCSSNTVFRINTLALAFPGLVLWQIIKAFVRIVIGIVRERVRENLANMNNTQETNA